MVRTRAQFSATSLRAAPKRPANPAVVALLNRANAAGRGAGNSIPAAASSLERAIKIDPGNPWLWHRLAASCASTRGEREMPSCRWRQSSNSAGGGVMPAAAWPSNWRLDRPGPIDSKGGD